MKKVKMIYIKSTTRMYPLEAIVEWKIGEGDYLKKMLGVGFYKTIFMKDGDEVNFYYEYDEVKAFEGALEKYLDEETFNDICDEFMRKIEKPDIKIREIVPHLTIFNEVDNYPEWFEEKYRADCQRRLLRVRKSTHIKLYELFKDLK